MSKTLYAFGKIGRTVKAVGPLIVGMVALAVIIAWLAGVFQTKIEPGETTLDVARHVGEPIDVSEMFLREIAK